MEKKSLYDISWKVDEPTYRKDPALSYSTLARYEREGFNNLDKLFDDLSTPSLTFGSAVDSLITGGQDEFDSRFMVAEYPSVPDSIVKIVKTLFSFFHETNSSLYTIDDEYIIKYTELYSYQLNWKPETRAKVIRDKGEEYYKLLFLAQDKVLLDTDTYNNIIKAVDSLKTSESTKWYFQNNNPFENVERFYQLKFKATFEGINFRCMLDECIVDHENKTIQPIDLKTSFKKEWDFYKSFVDWNYQIQNRLYYRILKDNIVRDPYFKDFKILPYIDIVVCGSSFTPLVWICDFTFALGTLTFGKDNNIVMRDPLEIGKELSYYLSHNPKVPIGIIENGVNDIRKWLNTL